MLNTLKALTITSISDQRNESNGVDSNRPRIKEENMISMMKDIPGEPHKHNVDSNELIKCTKINTLIKPKNINRAPGRKRLRFHTVAHIVVLLQKRLAQSKPMSEYMDVTNDVAYWRDLALSRGDQVKHFLKVMDFQKNRIDCLERDLGTLVRLAHETQKILTEGGPGSSKDEQID